MEWILLLALLAFTWVLRTLMVFHSTYQLARATNLPIVLSPVFTLNIPWLLLCKLTPVLHFLHKLPGFLSKWSKYTYIGWQYHDNRRIHDELGPAFVICSPGFNELHIADPEAAHSCLTRRKEFTKPPLMYEPLNVFGRNLDTVEGETWQRHRRLTAPNFNEKVSSSVWSESIRQAGQALAEWTSEKDGTRNVVDDTATLALHVLTSAGLNIQYMFNAARMKPEPPHTMTYRNALIEVLSNFVYLSAIPAKYMGSWFMPRKIRKISKACEEFKLYMFEMVNQEKQATAQRKEEKGNLLSAMVRASEHDTNEGAESTGVNRVGLTDEEVYGNLFIYNLAGHETTANTVATAISYLAANPRWQDWLSEEIEHVLGNESDPRHWSYERAFPKLTRCLALMYETLRLHGSVVNIPKETGSEERILRISGKEHVIPARTLVNINTHAIHCDPNIYSTPQEWKPDRWVVTSESGQEELCEIKPGTFEAWAEGPRVCPGKKFAQVEFAAVMASLFHRFKVQPAPEPGESKEKCTERLRANIEDSDITGITLQMNKPKDVKLIWSKKLKAH